MGSSGNGFEQGMRFKCSLEEYSSAMRTVGFLEGLSSYLWSQCDKPEGLATEACAFYDDRVEELRKLLAGAEYFCSPALFQPTEAEIDDLNQQLASWLVGTDEKGGPDE